MIPPGIGPWWRDPRNYAEPNQLDVWLSAYLATGDRPLRVLATFPDPGLSKTTDGLNWWCEGNTDFPGTQGIGDTPAAAILACAEALEERQ